MNTDERQLEEKFIEKLRVLKYEYRSDIRDRATLERNFRAKFEALNRVKLSEGEFSRLLEEIISPDVFTAARTLRERNSFTRGDALDQLDFEFVLFASADIDYDYIMNLIARFSSQAPAQQKMTRGQLIALIRSDAKFMDELEEISAYVRSLEVGQSLNEDQVRSGYQQFKGKRNAQEIADTASKHDLPREALADFVDTILQRMIFDGEQLTNLM